MNRWLYQGNSWWFLIFFLHFHFTYCKNIIILNRKCDIGHWNIYGKRYIGPGGFPYIHSLMNAGKSETNNVLLFNKKLLCFVFWSFLFIRVLYFCVCIFFLQMSDLLMSRLFFVLFFFFVFFNPLDLEKDITRFLESIRFGEIYQ